MSEMDNKILANQFAILQCMNEEQKALYLAFSEGMLAAKQQSGEKKD